jgi:hypothetical protein
VPDFLDDIDVDPEDRERLRALGATDARALRAMHRAAPDAFAAYIGPSTDHVLAQLDLMAPPEDDAARAPIDRVLAAQIGPAPRSLARPLLDLALRDRLFDELQQLRASTSSPERDAAIADLEDRLNALLDGSV